MGLNKYWRDTWFVQFNVLVWRRVLSARQTAFLTVAAWPAALDTISLAEALAADAGAPSTADLAAAGARTSTCNEC